MSAWPPSGAPLCERQWDAVQKLGLPTASRAPLLSLQHGPAAVAAPRSAARGGQQNAEALALTAHAASYSYAAALHPIFPRWMRKGRVEGAERRMGAVIRRAGIAARQARLTLVERLPRVRLVHSQRAAHLAGRAGLAASRHDHDLGCRLRVACTRSERAHKVSSARPSILRYSSRLRAARSECACGLRVRTSNMHQSGSASFSTAVGLYCPAETSAGPICRGTVRSKDRPQ